MDRRAMILRLIVYNMPSISYHITNSVESWLGERLYKKKQGKSKGFDSCNRPSNLTQIGFKSSICHPCDLEIWWMIIRHVFYTTSSFVYHFLSISEFKLQLQSGKAQSGLNYAIFLAVWLCNLTYDLEKQQGTSFMLLLALCIIS